MKEEAPVHTNLNWTKANPVITSMVISTYVTDAITEKNKYHGRMSLRNNLYESHIMHDVFVLLLPPFNPSHKINQLTQLTLFW